ncbi:(p)ppGpp synthetase [Oleiharenicola sp. Vm1]|uniref:(p)ppGpp synthetase n=1 Tax=Oleiharenicola sp. Vm1 TaxID=3398393 RepID=UPI0039F5D63C
MDFSGAQITKAGESLRKFSKLERAEKDRVLEVLAFFRLCHERPLDNAVKLLKETVLPIDRTAIFGKRLKRYVSIYRKLVRFETMTLRNMHDIGGCRAIVTTEKKLWQVVRALRRAKEFRSSTGVIRKKDYVTTPKDDGYRSYHLIGTFDGAGDVSRNIEVQIRTRIQHYWATALEIVDLFTGQTLKSNSGFPEWKVFFREVGLQFSIIDSIHMIDSIPASSKRSEFLKKLALVKDGRESLQRLQQLSKRLKVIEKLEGYANSIEIVNKQLELGQKRGYVLITIDPAQKIVNTKHFSEQENELANVEYLTAEKHAAKSGQSVVALVSSAAMGGIKESYPNYFADSTEFLKRLFFLESIA